MFIKIFTMLPFIFGVPDISVNWTDQKFKAFRVEVDAADALLSKCLKSGLAMEYTYRVQLCRRRPAWLDTCLEPLREKRTLSYDPISSSYQIVADKLGDEAGPETRHLTSLDEAQNVLAGIETVPLDYVGRGQSDYINSSRAYLSVRVQSDCRGDYNKTLARISAFLTMGLLRISGFDTGWMDFKLERTEAK